MFRPFNTLRWLIVAAALTLGLLTCLPAAVHSARGASFNRRAMAGKPAAPDQCTASPITIFSGGVQVDWRDNSDNEDGFTAEYWANPNGGGWVLQQAIDLPANTTSAVFRSPTVPRLNRYRVRAFNANGVSAWSKCSNF
jgi:hypothetical protein